MPEQPSYGWHCINCGKIWGGPLDIYSHGICIHCLAEWINMKKREKNLNECFGFYNQLLTVNCEECSVKKYCVEYAAEIFNVSL